MKKSNNSNLDLTPEDRESIIQTCDRTIEAIEGTICKLKEIRLNSKLLTN